MSDPFKPKRHRMATRVGITASTWLLCASLVLLSAQTQPSPKPFTKDDVVKLLTGNVPAKRVEALVRERSIDFQITPTTESELRKAGASDELLSTLRMLSPRVVTQQSPTPTAATLVIQSTPGGTHVYVDDEPLGTTSSEGRLKLSTLTAGQHRVRLSLDGYKEDSRDIALAAGATLELKETLMPNQPSALGGTVTQEGPSPSQKLSTPPSQGAHTSLAGVTLPDTEHVGATSLVLNGLGLRAKLAVKVYVAGLYVVQKSSDPNAIIKADAPKRIVMQFLHDANKNQMANAFGESFNDNAPDAMKTMKADIDRLLGSFEPVRAGDQVVFTYVPGTGTTLAINGKEKLTIAGPAFGEVIFSVWLGPKPPNADLKKGMLGQ